MDVKRGGDGRPGGREIWRGLLATASQALHAHCLYERETNRCERRSNDEQWDSGETNETGGGDDDYTWGNPPALRTSRWLSR